MISHTLTKEGQPVGVKQRPASMQICRLTCRLKCRLMCSEKGDCDLPCVF